MRRLPEVNDGYDRTRAQKMLKRSLLLLKGKTKSMNKLEPGRHITIEGLNLKEIKKIRLISLILQDTLFEISQNNRAI